MADREALDAKLVELLAGIDFAGRYYAYYAAVRQRARMPDVSQQELVEALAATSLDFKYNKKEKFFAHQEQTATCLVGLNIGFPISSAEFILNVKAAPGWLGGPYSVLARRIERLRDPDFEHDPYYPTLPFGNRDELRETVNFGVGLWQEAKQVIAAYPGWNE